MKNCLAVLILLMLSACGAGQYGTSYRAYIDPMTASDVIRLGEKQKPIIIPSSDLNRTVRSYREHNYIVVGESAFNGVQESTDNAMRQAEEIGATHVVVSSEFTDTQSQIAYDYQDFYRTIYVHKVKTVDGKQVYYSEAVTVHDTVSVPYTRYYNNFNQWAVYLVQSLKPRKLGLMLVDLDAKLRSEIGRNTGAYIDLVLESSPAFFANIMAQDVLIGINGTEILNKSQAQTLIDQLDISGKTIIVTVLHEGKRKDISLEFYK